MTKEEFKNQIVLKMCSSIWETMQEDYSDEFIASSINHISNLIVDKCYENE